jgi:urease accessory protein
MRRRRLRTATRIMAMITVNTMIITMTTLRTITPTMIMIMIMRMIAAMMTAMSITCMMSIAGTTTITVIPMLMTTNELPRASEAMIEAEAAALYRLMTFLSPAFPVGAFAYSSGIEWAVEAGDITDAATLRGWLTAMLVDGSGFCDAVFLAQAYRAMDGGDMVGLRDVAELAAACVPSRERQLETTTQGRAFIEIARAAWNCDGLDDAVAECNTVIYPIAVGLVSAAHGIPLPSALHAFLHALVSNWISAGSRLIPLGQTDSQRVLAALEGAVSATASRAQVAALDDLGSASFRADLASLRHETQYTRLFRS